tara:strand:+ start:214 stop:438 length:225 start_codon:yes stop_codon:yes gene_type:complete
MSEINKKKKLSKGCLVYKLEIAYNKDTDTVQYICESIDKEGFTGPVDTNWDYLEDYFDDEDIQVMDSLYEVGEA